MISFLLKNLPKALTFVVNARRPLAVKAISSILITIGLVENYDNAAYIVEFLLEQKNGLLLIAAVCVFFIFATKDVAGVFVNMQKTLKELGNLIALLFLPIKKLYLLIKKKNET